MANSNNKRTSTPRQATRRRRPDEINVWRGTVAKWPREISRGFVLVAAPRPGSLAGKRVSTNLNESSTKQIARSRVSLLLYTARWSVFPFLLLRVRIIIITLVALGCQIASGAQLLSFQLLSSTFRLIVRRAFGALSALLWPASKRARKFLKFLASGSGDGSTCAPSYLAVPPKPSRPRGQTRQNTKWPRRDATQLN